MFKQGLGRRESVRILPMNFAHPRLRPGLEDRDDGSPPVLVIDAGAGAIVDANAAAWSAWGVDAASVAPPVAIDRAMPALQRLVEIADACGDGGRNEVLTFWSARGLLQLHCHVRQIGAGQSIFVARALNVQPAGNVRAIDEGSCAAATYPGATSYEVTPTARLAHELRTPLSAAIAYAEILKDEHFGPLANARYREYARNIYDSARHALGVVDGMLGSDPARSGVPELAFTDLDLARVIENCLSVARPLAEQAGLHLVAELAPRIPRIVADEVSLKQMLLNLLTNAIKFARRGDRVTVGVVYELGGPLRIAVADTGPGMCQPPLALEGGRAGRRMRKVRNAGLGIGLPLTQALAEANGATLVIDSAPGRGTRVTISFGKDRVVPV